MKWNSEQIVFAIWDDFDEQTSKKKKRYGICLERLAAIHRKLVCMLNLHAPFTLLGTLVQLHTNVVIC